MIAFFPKTGELLFRCVNDERSGLPAVLSLMIDVCAKSRRWWEWNRHADADAEEEEAERRDACLGKLCREMEISWRESALIRYSSAMQHLFSTRRKMIAKGKSSTWASPAYLLSSAEQFGYISMSDKEKSKQWKSNVLVPIVGWWRLPAWCNVALIPTVVRERVSCNDVSLSLSLFPSPPSSSLPVVVVVVEFCSCPIRHPSRHSSIWTNSFCTLNCFVHALLMSLTVLLSLCLLWYRFGWDRGCYSSFTTADEHEMPSSRSNSEQPPSSTMNRSAGSKQKKKERNAKEKKRLIDAYKDWWKTSPKRSNRLPNSGVRLLVSLDR